jgi:uncharacterized protein involved in exopolysaccharide biosynthesis
MTSYTPTVNEYLAVLRRRKWQFIVPVVLLSVASTIVAAYIPAKYRSEATILVEQQDVTADLVPSGVTSLADQRIQLISQRVMSTANLGSIIAKFDLYPEARQNQSINAAVEILRNAITIDVASADIIDPRTGRQQQATIAFSIGYENKSPEVAQKVAEELVSLFLAENLEQRKAAVEEASVFLTAEADKLGRRITDLEARLASFKEAHQGSLPEFSQLNRELLARTETKLSENAQAIRTLSEQQVFLQSELAQLSPIGGSGDQQISPEARLRELETLNVALAARYSADHPDRVQLRGEIAALRAEIGQSDIRALQQELARLQSELALLTERYSDAHPDVQAVKRSIAATRTEVAAARRAGLDGAGLWAINEASNPAYVELRARLDASRLEMGALKAEREELEERLAALEGRIAEAPQIELEYKALVRDYDNALARYNEVRDKQMQAELAAALEVNRKGERFSQIEPPVIPEAPFSPNRPVILLLGLVLSAAAGAGHVALREVMDDRIYGALHVERAAGAPPLVAVPVIETAADRRRKAVKRVGWTLGAVAVLVILGVVLHRFGAPLESLWPTVASGVER